MTSRKVYCRLNNERCSLLLLRLARISITPAESSELEEKILVAHLDTHAKTPSPIMRALLPLLFYRVSQSSLRDRLEKGTQIFLRDNTMRLIAAEIGFKQWLIKHIEVFEKENIPVILLKGAAFSENLYPENAPRLGADLDILVKESEFDTVCNLLCKTMKSVLLDPKRVTTHETLFERVFIPKSRNGPAVEIHRGLTNPSIFTIDYQELWQTSRPHPSYNSELVRILSPENTLLHLAVHAFRDLNFCNHNLLDAHEVWCQWKPDPDKLFEHARKWGARKVLYYLLANCKAIMGTPIPNTLVDRSRPRLILDKVNMKILQSRTPHNARNRALQLLSQLTFPDRIRQGIKYQLYYAKTRIEDFCTST